MTCPDALWVMRWSKGEKNKRDCVLGLLIQYIFIPHPQPPAEIFWEYPLLSRLCSHISSSLSISLWLRRCARLVPEKVQFAVCPQRGGGKRIWLMHIPSLYIHDYFLESIRKTWLIQVGVLIEVRAVSAVDFPSFIFQILLPLFSIFFSVGLISSFFSRSDLCPPYYLHSVL